VRRQKFLYFTGCQLVHVFTLLKTISIASRTIYGVHDKCDIVGIYENTSNYVQS